MTLALDGIRVLDQTQVMAGPTCTMLLADMGAEVIKIEPPGGETTRGMEPMLEPGLSAAFLAVNRNKRSVALDLKHPRGLEAFRKLVATADILVENYRPGVARRLGVDHEALGEINPALVYCSISGFGQTGPYAARGGYDLIAQGMSGIMSVTGHEGRPPVKVGVPITDLGAGLFAVFGILCALRARRLTGRGQHVDTSLFEAGLALSQWEATEFWCTGRVPARLGTAHRLNAPYQAFRARDGYFTVGASNDRLWPRLCHVLHLDDLARDPRFLTLAGRTERRAELERVIEAVTRTKPRAHWLARCDEAGIPAGPINTIPEAHADPQAQARGMVQELDHPRAGRVKALGNPVKMSTSPPQLRTAAPLLGEDTASVLAELGYAEGEIASLTADGAAALSGPLAPGEPRPRRIGIAPDRPVTAPARIRMPLEGLRVIDLTQAMAGPFCTMTLADMGAEVVKIEPQGEGEPTRRDDAVQQNGVSGSFLAVNRGKKSLTVDLKKPEGVEIVKRLARRADVLVQNYRPGVVQRLGVGYDDLAHVNPRLVYCSVSGFGATGPYAGRGGYDLVAQGMSGIISVTGEEDGPPAKAGIPVSDLAAGLFAAYGVLAALEYRDRTGHGQHVDTSLFEAALALTVWESTEYWATGRVPGPLGSAHRFAAPYQAVRAADGHLTIGANTDRLFEGLCRALDRPELVGDPRFSNRTDRLVNRAALIAEIERTTETGTRAHWLARLDAHGVPSGPIHTYPEALADPHTLARRMVVDLRHPVAGPIKALGVPVKLSETPGAVERAAPLVGEHTAEILAELGYSTAEQQRLRGARIV
jgi:crotonobetainyl-CoA:carnitine CoA-transferase CaiB-like acyl-CoA transferase